MNELIVLPEIWVGVIAFLIPLATALSTKYAGSTAKKALVAGALVIAVAVLEQATADAFTWEGLLTTALIAGITQVTAYVGFWKPIVDVNARALPEVGV